MQASGKHAEKEESGRPAESLCREHPDETDLSSGGGGGAFDRASAALLCERKNGLRRWVDRCQPAQAATEFSYAAPVQRETHALTILAAVIRDPTCQKSPGTVTAAAARVWEKENKKKNPDFTPGRPSRCENSRKNGRHRLESFIINSTNVCRERR